jgi:hypothetical protein
MNREENEKAPARLYVKNCGCFKIDQNVASIGPALSEIPGSGGCPSGKKRMTTINIKNVRIARTRKTHCQPNPVAINPPNVGASRGDNPMTSTNNEKILALCSTGKKSRAMASAATQATQPPNACIKRSTTKASMVCACIQPTDVII